MTKSNFAALLDCLDAWRHLPAYQLERRADIFFGLYLPGVLDLYLRPRGVAIDPRIIPEFPLGQGDTNLSDKVDFFAVSQDREYAFLIELKTDMSSLRERQEATLKRAVERGLDALLNDIKAMAKARDPQTRRKYFHLLKAVSALDLMTLPAELEDRIYGPPVGVYDCIDRIAIRSALPTIGVIHILPKKVDGKDCIDFEYFATIVEGRGELGRRFAGSLRNWASTKAGGRRPGQANPVTP